MKNSLHRSRNEFATLALLSVFIIGILAFSCKNQSSQSKSADESFESFYHRFHQDSAFQMSRIRFPLPGINTDNLQMEDTAYYWTKEDWEIHRDMKLDTTDFIVEKDITDSLAVEKIYKENSGFIVERTFKKLHGRWFLIFYKDINL